MRDIFYVIVEEEKRLKSQLNQTLEADGIEVDFVKYEHPGRFRFMVSGELVAFEVGVHSSMIADEHLYPVAIENIKMLLQNEKHYKELGDVKNELEKIEKENHVVITIEGVDLWSDNL